MTTPLAGKSLKPCPFCGGKASSGEAVHDYDDHGLYSVCCRNCPAEIEAADLLEAEIAWNTRHQGDAEELYKEALEK